MVSIISLHGFQRTLFRFWVQGLELCCFRTLQCQPSKGGWLGLLRGVPAPPPPPAPQQPRALQLESHIVDTHWIGFGVWGLGFGVRGSGFGV